MKFKSNNLQFNLLKDIIKPDVIIELGEDISKISCSKFIPMGNPRGVIVFTAGVGMQQTFFYNFISFLRNGGYIVYTLDYRSIGASKYYPIKKYDLKLVDWKDDINLLINHVVTNHPSDKITYVCHSYGGQIFGYVNKEQIGKVIAIASQNGYWRYYSKPRKHFFFWYLLIPLLTKIFGYLPAKRFNMGEDLPKGVIYQWKKWCTSTNFLFDDASLENLDVYHEFKGKIHAVSFDDDKYGGHEAVESMMSNYDNSDLDLIKIDAEEYGMRIGHTGFFRLKPDNKIWKMIIDLI